MFGYKQAMSFLIGSLWKNKTEDQYDKTDEENDRDNWDGHEETGHDKTIDQDDETDWSSHDHLLLIELQHQKEQLDLQLTGSSDRFLKADS